MSTNENLNFTPKEISSPNLKLLNGTEHKTPIGLIQKIAALRASSAFSSSNDWMEKLSLSYIVAITTRSADELLMQTIQLDLTQNRQFDCKGCKQSTLGIDVIRQTLFPKIKQLRQYANKLVHHLDTPGNIGVSELNIEGVYEYCFHLFQENSEALFGNIPDPTGKFPEKKCKKCRENA